MGGQRGVEPLDVLAVGNRILLPTPIADHDLARPVGRVARLDDRAHGGHNGLQGLSRGIPLRARRRQLPYRAVGGESARFDAHPREG